MSASLLKPNTRPLSVHCDATKCPFHDTETCTLDAEVRIGTDGRCEACTLSASNRAKEAPVRCKSCGLDIARASDGRWHHLGVHLPHPAAPEEPLARQSGAIKIAACAA